MRKDVGEQPWLPATDQHPESLSSLSPEDVGLVDKLVEKIKSWSSEHTSYLSAALLLNMLSTYIARAEIAKTETENSAKPLTVAFLVTANTALPGDSLDAHIQPHMVARVCRPDQLESYINTLKKSMATSDNPNLPSLDDLRPAWGQVLGTLEFEKRNTGKCDIGNYMWVNKMYRVDLPHIIGLAACRGGFNLYMLCPNVEMQASQEDYAWNDYQTLMRYVKSLYLCHRAKDPNFDCLPVSAQAWVCQVEGKKYIVFPFYATRAPGRCTWVAAGADLKTRKPVVLKVYWADDNSHAIEGEICEKLKGVKDVMQPVAFECAPDVEKMDWGDKSRQKYYLLTEDLGLPLSKCEKLTDFLHLMIDLCEALKNVHKKGVYHRDVSWNNVLIKATVNEDGEVEIQRPEDGRCEVMLTDFDQSIRSEDVHKGRLNRTGTPMFVARDFASERPQSHSSWKAIGDLHRSYPQAVPKSFVRRIKDTFKKHAEKETTPVDQSKEREEGQDRENRKYKRRHDAESVFWIITWFLARIWPSDQSLEASAEYQRFVRTMLNHTIGPAAPERERSDWMTRSEPMDWTLVLHPSLRACSVQLTLIGRYFGIDWRRSEVGMSDDHACDFIQAVLRRKLEQVEKDSGEVEFNQRWEPGIATPRPCRPCGVPAEVGIERTKATSTSFLIIVSGTRSSTRRKRSAPDGTNESGPEAKRIHLDGSAGQGGPEGAAEIPSNQPVQSATRSLSEQVEEIDEAELNGTLITSELLKMFNEPGVLDNWAKMSESLRASWIEGQRWFSYGPLPDSYKFQ